MIARIRARRLAPLCLAAAVFAVGPLGSSAEAQDQPGLFGRLFRGAQGNTPPRGSATNTPRPGSNLTGPVTPPPVVNPGGLPTQPNPNLPAFGDVGAPPLTPGQPARSAANPFDGFTPPPGGPGISFSSGTEGPSDAPPIRPMPRNSKAATEADPILTRVALGRTSDGGRFGMFLQVYADGTVIDGEGTHQASPQALRSLIKALEAPELSRVSGHCGSPSADYIEQVHMVVFERKFGGLKANSFSYAGNPAGCDPAIRALHVAVEAFQATLSGAPTLVEPETAAPSLGDSAPPVVAPVGESLSLTPVR